MVRQHTSAGVDVTVAEATERDSAPSATDAVEAARAAVAAAEDAAAPPSCTICLDPLSAKRELQLQPCGHYFHRTCVMNWMETRETKAEQLCPNCRAAVATVRNHRGEARRLCTVCWGETGKPTKNVLLRIISTISLTTYIACFIRQIDYELLGAERDKVKMQGKPSVILDIQEEIDTLTNRKNILSQMVEIHNEGGMRIPDPQPQAWNYLKEKKVVEWLKLRAVRQAIDVKIAQIEAALAGNGNLDDDDGVGANLQASCARIRVATNAIQRAAVPHPSAAPVAGAASAGPRGVPAASTPAATATGTAAAANAERRVGIAPNPFRVPQRVTPAAGTGHIALVRDPFSNGISIGIRSNQAIPAHMNRPNQATSTYVNRTLPTVHHPGAPSFGRPVLMRASLDDFDRPRISFRAPSATHPTIVRASPSFAAAATAAAMTTAGRRDGRMNASATPAAPLAVRTSEIAAAAAAPPAELSERARRLARRSAAVENAPASTAAKRARAGE